jgi:hypothetical protein
VTGNVLGSLTRFWGNKAKGENTGGLLVLEPLTERQIKALRRLSGIATLRVMMNMSDFLLDLATKGGRRDEMEQLARVVYGEKPEL